MKLGVTSLNEDKLKELFKIYDINQNGDLDYKEFTLSLYPVQIDEEAPQETGVKETKVYETKETSASKRSRKNFEDDK